MSLHSFFAGVTSILLVVAGLAFFGGTAQAVVTATGTFTGYSVADIKAYGYNSGTVTSTMTTATSFSLNGSTNIELARNGAGSPFQKYTVNGPSAVDCISTPCASGDSRLNGFTFSILDSSNNPIPTTSAQFTMYDALVRVSFTGASSATVPAGSTIKFEFAANTVLGHPNLTDQIRTVDVNSTALIDQTPVYNWFKKVIFNGNPASASSLAFSGTDFVLATDSSPSSTLPSSLFRSGFTLASWNTLANGTGTSYALGSAFTYPTQSTTLYAQWTVAPKIVTFNNNTGSGSMSQQSSAVAANLTSNSFTKSGFTFAGWNTLANGTGTAYANGASFPFSANTTLYAQWTLNASTVTFDANGGTGTLASQSSSTAVNLTSNTSSITRAGYTFAGWNTLANGTGTAYANGASYPFSSSATLYARWTAISNTVTYDAHGGTAVADGSFLTGGSIASLPSAPTRAGYTFNGWFAAASGGSALANGYSPPATSGITLHAQWTGTTNTVTYDSHGGSPVTSGSFVTGGTIANLAVAPTKAGYSFAGWFVAASGGSALSNGYAPSATTGITLHAQWTGLSQTVTFDGNGGTGSMTAQTSGAAATLTTNTIARAGFGFTGWNTAANGSGTSYAVDATHPFTSSETLYAQWRALPATPVAAVDIQVPVGSAIANAPVDLDVDGLKDQTGYTVTVYSTPQIIDQGTIWSGRLNTTVRIPSNLEAGWHRLVIEGTAADGTPWTEVNFFKVSPGGILLATSEVVPAELAVTGANPQPVFFGAAFLILVGLGFVAANSTLRRRGYKQ